MAHGNSDNISRTFHNAFAYAYPDTANTKIERNSEKLQNPHIFTIVRRSTAHTVHSMCDVHCELYVCVGLGGIERKNWCLYSVDNNTYDTNILFYTPAVGQIV